jgi:hypothetical protein
VVRTFNGGEVDGTLTARWDKRDGKGALVPDGTYTFKLTARPADGSGVPLTVPQTVKVSDARPWCAAISPAAARRSSTGSVTS